MTIQLLCTYFAAKNKKNSERFSKDFDAIVEGNCIKVAARDLMEICMDRKIELFSSTDHGALAPESLLACQGSQGATHGWRHLTTNMPRRYHLLQGDPRHWTPENLAQALYKIRHLESFQVSRPCL